MATCRECLHYDVCRLKKNVICTLKDVIYKEYQTLPNIENVCGEFTPKSDYVKRERGEWIKEHRRFSTNYGWCAKPIFICSRCGTAYWSEQDFCEVCKADMRKEDNNG